MIPLLVRPERIQRGQILWMQLVELSPVTHVAVRVIETIPRARRAQVRVLCAFEAATISVDYGLLFEEAPQ